MSNDTSAVHAGPTWGSLEAFARDQVQQFIQRILEEEVTELLGRARSERRAVDAPAEYRNGHGKPRRLSMQGGTVTLRRPRVRGLEARFESKVLPLFERRTAEVGQLLPELYLHGLALGDFELALRGLLGDGAPLSASSIARLRAGWETEFAEWRRRELRDRELVYAWADGVYVRAGLEKDKAALLVVVGAMRDGRKELLALVSGHRESTESWSEVLRDLRDRGLSAPKLLVGDGALGIWAALGNVWPGVRAQRCWNHKVLNVLDKLPRRLERHATLLLRGIAYAQAERLREKFAQRFADQPEAIVCLGPRLGRAHQLLRLPGRTLEAPAHEQRRREPLRQPAPPDRRGQALQERDECDRADLACAPRCRVALAQARCAGAFARRLRGKEVRRREADHASDREGSRLMPFTHLLTRAPAPSFSVKAVAVSSSGNWLTDTRSYGPIVQLIERSLPPILSTAAVASFARWTVPSKYLMP